MQANISITRLIEHLESIQKRPSMYFGKLDPKIANHFLSGFSLAANALLGIACDVRIRIHEKVLAERGWKSTPMVIVPQLTKRNFSSEEIVAEHIAIEIAYWKQTEIEVAKLKNTR